MNLPWKPLLAVSAAAGSALFTAMLDCNPKLFLYERFFFDPKNGYRDRNVWIIGASSGIGSEMALQLAKAHCRCLILSSRNKVGLEDLADQCRQHEPSCECICLPLDVTDYDSLESAVDQVRNRLPSLDLDMVVLNAGAGQLCPALETDPDVVQRVFQTNAVWPMILTPLLIGNANSNGKRGTNSGLLYAQRDDSSSSSPPSILVTSSVASLIPVPLSAPYAAAKAAMQQYFLSLATERPDLKIDIVCPGPVDTKFHSNHIRKNDKNEKGTNTETEGSETTDQISGMEAKKKTVKKASPLKMSVERCVRLMLAAAAGSHGGVSESWIAAQPTLAALYLNKLFPGLMRSVLSRIGTKRVQMWR
eukprot:CAMPEP_0198146850 /NCGR_PEP_ID=MMETSP1443-20131203/31762_1 /TAXON_ID=186043 /ORGANISM="Entomoneis sp., Strain CCMP2396" /LENGTH=361 /DNA_ID=CAMNT_0043810941 /DNA_START=116 /DNA_END=1198 /DNA_ORIENTATION=-